MKMALRLDDPPYSRLFVVYPSQNRSISDQEFREKFEEYGTIEDIWIVKDKRTNEDRGIVYIKFSKTSEAFLAMEQASGYTMPGLIKPLKIMIANSKSEGSKKTPKDEEKLQRLFIMVPKSFTDSDLREEFEKYGDLDHATAIKDRATGECKGYGFVKYQRPYHTSIAFENCDQSSIHHHHHHSVVFKPKFAEPQRSREEMDSAHNNDNNNSGHFSFGSSRMYRGQKRMFDDDGGMHGDYRQAAPHMASSPFSAGPLAAAAAALIGGMNPLGGGNNLLGGDRSSNIAAGNRYSGGMSCTGGGGGNSGDGSAGNGYGPLTMLSSYPAQSNCCRIQIVAPIGMTHGYLSKLFNLIPGMDYCDLNEMTGMAYARYANPQSAAYARDKLNGFEYPIGTPLKVQLAEEGSVADGYSQQNSDISVPQGRADTMVDLSSMAASLLEKAGITPHTLMAAAGNPSNMFSGPGGITMERINHCSIPLPLPQPIVMETPIFHRLFVVCQPAPIHDSILKDAFCRFGDLIDIFLLSGRNYGYARYTTKEAAVNALETMHGQTLAGQKIKVMEAEPPPPMMVKKLKM